MEKDGCLCYECIAMGSRQQHRNSAAAESSIIPASYQRPTSDRPMPDPCGSDAKMGSYAELSTDTQPRLAGPKDRPSAKQAARAKKKERNEEEYRSDRKKGIKYVCGQI